jgi:pantothenate kinase
MTLAGLDLGTSLAKAVWGEPRQAQTAPLEQVADLIAALRADGVTRVGLAGVSYQRVPLDGFEVLEVTGAEIDRELAVQADGVRQLLAEEGRQPERFLAVSLGTGISYTLAEGQGTRRFPLGSAVGGGFLRGLSQLLGAPSWEAFLAEAAQGQPVDLLVEDQLPATRGTPTGRLVLAHFGRADADTPRPDAFASLFSTVATGVARDLALMQFTPGFEPPEPIVFVGSLAQVEPLKGALTRYVQGLLGREPLFPAQGAYALALGALRALGD